jgi:hypothetical protein
MLSLPAVLGVSIGCHVCLGCLLGAGSSVGAHLVAWHV